LIAVLCAAVVFAAIGTLGFFYFKRWKILKAPALDVMMEEKLMDENDGSHTDRERRPSFAPSPDMSDMEKQRFQMYTNKGLASF